MTLIDMNDYSPAARRYWWTVTVLGGLALVYSLFRVALLPAGMQIQIFAGAAVAAIVGLFPVRIPGAKTGIAGAEIFIFLVMLLYGPYAAVIAASFEGFASAIRGSKRVTSRLGTPAVASLSMMVCATAFEIARNELGGPAMTNGVLMPTLFAFALAYFACGTVLANTLIALKTHSPVTPIRWIKSFGWIALAYLTGASIAALLYVSHHQFGLTALLVSVPLIAMFLSSLHLYFQRKEDDQRHVEELKESESRFHSAFTHAAIGMALVSSEGKFIQANRAFCDMIGRTTPDLLTSNLNSLVNPEDLGALQTPVSKLLKG
jgi:PAS domain-containing protein